MDKQVPARYSVKDNPPAAFLHFTRWFLGFCGLFLFYSMAAKAEGSKDLIANGGYRAYLFSSDTASSSFPFPTLGTVKVYVKAGETIYAGSSAQGLNSGTMNFRAPDGTIYTSGNNTTLGFIANNSQEQAGPAPNAGGYTPFTITATASQEGVWEVDFISPDNGIDNGLPPPVAANAPWAQYYSEYITAFDVSVRNAANTQFVTGRAFTNVYCGVLGDFVSGFNAIFHIITSDGYQYTLNNNGQAGDAFTFFVNNKGFRNADGTPSYKSIDGFNNLNIQDPRAADSLSDVTQKIFFNALATDLPASAKTPKGTTWLFTTPLVASLSPIIVKGVEGTVGKAGTAPLGANFTFTSTVAGTYSILIDVNKNGVFTDPVDRKLTGSVIAGPNQIYWDGLDGTGARIAAGPASFNSNISLAIKAGEVHFPFFDVERNVNGIILTRLNGTYAPDDTLYWNDAPITIVGTPPNPITNLTGISSKLNGHKWGTATTDPGDDQDFGNNKSIDTWSFIESPPLSGAASVVLQQADLETDSIKTVANCAGQPVLFTFNVKNNGPSDVTGARVHFDFPAIITNVNVSSSSSSGTSAVSGGAVTAGAYDTNIDLADGAVRTFIITGKIDSTATGSVSVSASILRPADVTDPDATNPDTAPPTDPVAECNALPSGPGCNNIQSSVTGFKAASGAGADQTVSTGGAITLTGTGEGTWTQASGDPAVAIITSPTSASTTVTGLTNPGAYHFIYTNASSCADTVTVDLVVTGIVIPNIFTPNGDGKNDLFVIKGLDSFPGSQLLIFNRWGNEVYRAGNYLNDWDGSGLAEGTYYYILNRKNTEGPETPYKGWVFLKRTK